MKFSIPLMVLLLVALYSKAQKVSYNAGIEATSPETKEVMALFENYISSSPEKLGDNPFWNKSEKEKHKRFDFLEAEFQPSLYMGFPVHVLSISSHNGLYKIKAQFSYCQENGTPYILAIVNYFAEKENGKFYLKNALTVNKRHWNSTTLGLITFYYPKNQPFSIENAEKLNTDMREMCKNLNVEPIPFEYYFADDYEDIQLLKGIDYSMGMGGEKKPTGKATDDKVYCGGLGENYLHEVYHVQVDRMYPNQHGWTSEGMATFLGGSRGKSLDWHVKRTNEFLKNNPTINLNTLVTLKNLDEYTGYQYVLGGLIVKKVFDKGGWPLIIEFMATGKEDTAYYLAIEKYLGIKQSQLNEYMRATLEQESTRN